MRIIAGRFRGRRLQAPKGATTRPTTDRVRESLMSMLSSARGGFAGAVVLDAFAGSGALGLEALSRGAARVRFCEHDGAALRVLRANIDMLGVARTGAHAQAGVFAGDVVAKPPVWVRPPFDLVFLDPPYAMPASRALGVAAALAQGGALAEGALVSYEHDASRNDETDAAVDVHGLTLASRRKYGDTVIDLLQVHGSDELPRDDGLSHTVRSEQEKRRGTT